MEHGESKLHWENPLLDDDFVSDLVTIISPYATSTALRKLFEKSPPPQGLQLITSWTSDALIHGAADPEVFKVVEEYQGRLYLHDRIHLKLYVCSTRHAVLSTGNLTNNGLGFSAKPNIEASSVVNLNAEDWNRISDILLQSIPVTAEVYEAAVAYCEQHNKTASGIPKFEIPVSIVKEDLLSWQSLPACKTPDVFWAYYTCLTEDESPEEMARYAHDLQIFDMPSGLDKEAFYSVLSSKFSELPLVKKLADWIESEQSARFGRVKIWLQDNCSDKPTPYRWELTPAIQALYEWLDTFHPNITWHRPSHSQILQWKVEP